MGFLLKALIASAVLGYTTTAIAMPWEVGKCLLQVQWVPRDVEQVDDSEPPTEEVAEEISDDESGEESYFADPLNSVSSRFPVPHAADEQGYVVRRNVMEESTRPDYVIPVGSADGVWAMMKKLGQFRGEGWLALWKGLLTECITELLSSAMQPLIQQRPTKYIRSYSGPVIHISRNL